MATAIWSVADGRLRAYQGGYEDYLDQREQESAAVSHPPEIKRPPAPAKRRQVARGAGRSAVRTLLSEAETRISRLEDRVTVLTDELAQASQLMQVDRVRELGMEYQTVQEELEGAYLQWGKALASVERSGMGPETT